MRIFGSISELVNLVFRKNSQAITLRPNQSTTYTASRDIQLPPGDAAHVIISADSTQTLTNKSIDADTNTITNIENADIKSGAAIDASKIADGSVSNAEFQALNGVSGTIVDTTSVQTLTNKSLVDASTQFIDDGDNTKIAKFQVSGITTGTTRTYTLPDADTSIVGPATTDTLTNKTIDGDNNTVQDLAITSLKTVLADADKVLRRDAAGVPQSGNTIPNTSALVTIDSTQQITNKDIDGGTASNSLRVTVPKNTTANLAALTRKQATIAYDTTLASLVVDDGSAFVSVGGSSSSNSFNIRASEGAGTTTLTSSDNNNQRFNLSADRTVVLPSTGVAQGEVWVMLNPNQFRLTIEASDNSDIVWSWGDQVELVALISTPVASTDWAVKSKTIIVGRTPVSYTPTIGGWGTISQDEFWWKRTDNFIEVYGSFVAQSGAASLASISLPGSFQIDPNFLPAQGANNLGDTIVIVSNGAVAYPTNSKVVSLFEPSQTDTDIYFATTNNNGNPQFSAQNASAMFGVAGDIIQVYARMPIVQLREI